MVPPNVDSRYGRARPGTSHHAEGRAVKATSEQTSLSLRLERTEVVSFEPAAGCLVLRCESGVAWVTELLPAILNLLSRNVHASISHFSGYMVSSG